jgi:hypothetical protein
MLGEDSGRCAQWLWWRLSTAHTVLIEDATLVMKDWIFLEELPAVNVIIHTLEGRYGVFRQKKYTILGETLYLSTGAKEGRSQGIGIGEPMDSLDDQRGDQGQGCVRQRPIDATSTRGTRRQLEMEDISKIIVNIANPLAYNNDRLWTILFLFSQWLGTYSFSAKFMYSKDPV